MDQKNLISLNCLDNPLNLQIRFTLHLITIHPFLLKVMFSVCVGCTDLSAVSTFWISDNITWIFFYTLTNAAIIKNRMPSPVISASHSGSNSHPTKSAILGSAAARKSPFSEKSMFGVVPLFTWGARADGFKMASRW